MERLRKAVQRSNRRESPEAFVWTRKHFAKLIGKLSEKGWRIQDEAEDGFLADWAHVRVICSGKVEADGKRWVHVSVSDQRTGTIPTWQTLKDVKALFLGDVLAIQVLPPQSKFVNVAEVLHLFHCLDGSSIPDFSYKGKSV